MLFDIFYKINKNFSSRFDNNLLIFTRKSFSFHANSMISFDNFDNNVKIASEKIMIFVYKASFYQYEILIRYSLFSRQFLQ